MFNNLQLNLIQSTIPVEEENEIVNNLINGVTDKVLQSEFGKYIFITPVSPEAEEKLNGKGLYLINLKVNNKYLNSFNIINNQCNEFIIFM